MGSFQERTLLEQSQYSVKTPIMQSKERWVEEAGETVRVAVKQIKSGLLAIGASREV